MNTISFTATVVPGAGRGKTLNAPTLNLALDAAPRALSHGVYACFVTFDGSTEKLLGALHYGPRLVFGDSVSLEVHLIDRTIATSPASLNVDVVSRIRDVQHFDSPASLMSAIQQDVSSIRTLLLP